MGMLVWVMMGIAVWHFTVFVPDRFFGGIVGAFMAAIVSAALFGYLVNGARAGANDTELIQAFIAIPGALIGLTSPTSGAPRRRGGGIDHGHTRAGAR